MNDISNIKKAILNAECSTQQLVITHEQSESMLSNGKIEEFDQFLLDALMTEYEITTQITILTASKPWENVLSNRKLFFDKVRFQLLRMYSYNEVQTILSDL